MTGDTGEADDAPAPEWVGTPGDGWLHAYGRLEWSGLTELVGAAPCAWADYHGFHIGGLLATPPPYTHLWAWSPGWLIRVRVDYRHAIVGLLQVGADPPPRPVGSPTPVHYVEYPGQTWPKDEKRVELPGYLADHRIDLFQIHGERPVTFVRPVTGRLWSPQNAE